MVGVVPHRKDCKITSISRSLLVPLTTEDLMFWYPRWFHIKLSKYPLSGVISERFRQPGSRAGSTEAEMSDSCSCKLHLDALPLLPLNFHGFDLEEKSPTVAKCKILTNTHTSEDCKKNLPPKLNKAAVLLQEYKRTFHGYNPAVHHILLFSLKCAT